MGNDAAREWDESAEQVTAVDAEPWYPELGPVEPVSDPLYDRRRVERELDEVWDEPTRRLPRCLEG